MSRVYNFYHFSCSKWKFILLRRLLFEFSFPIILVFSAFGISGFNDVTLWNLIIDFVKRSLVEG